MDNTFHLSLIPKKALSITTIPPLSPIVCINAWVFSYVFSEYAASLPKQQLSQPANRYKSPLPPPARLPTTNAEPTTQNNSDLPSPFHLCIPLRHCPLLRCSASPKHNSGTAQFPPHVCVALTHLHPQVIGLNIFQGAMLVYAAIQVEQIHDAIIATQTLTQLDFDPWPSTYPLPPCSVVQRQRD